MIYVDLSDLVIFARTHSTLSGVQRVSLQLLSELIEAQGSNNIRILAFHPISKCLVSLDSAPFIGSAAFDQAQFCALFGMVPSHAAGKQGLEDYLKSRYRKPSRIFLQRLRYKVANRVTRGRTFQKRQIQAPKIVPANQVRVNETPLPVSGDVVFLPGATWNMPDHMRQIRVLSAQGVKVAQLIYDLIPLVAGEFVAGNLAEHFAAWLAEISEIATVMISISAATDQDLAAFLKTKPYSPRRKVLPLAHEFSGYRRGQVRDQSLDGITPSIRAAARLPFVLCVGTLEPRKNSWLLARVWEEIVAEMGISAPRLIFAGSPGWLNDDFDDFMKGSGYLKGHIRIAERPTDRDLAFLYQSCLFSVYPSYYEGWGLPVGESLWFGKPVICSNTSSVPEAAANICTLIDPYSPGSLKVAIQSHLDAAFRANLVTTITATPLRAWSMVAADLWQTLHDL